MFLGLDIGTSVIKAVTFDEAGRECASALERLPASSPQPGWSELDADSLWAKVVVIIRKLQFSPGFVASDIKAIGVTGIMAGAWILDEFGRLLRPPILWNDVRAEKW